MEVCVILHQADKLDLNHNASRHQFCISERLFITSATSSYSLSAQKHFGPWQRQLHQDGSKISLDLLYLGFLKIKVMH